MRVLCCHARADDRPGLYPETLQALEAFTVGHTVELVDCTGNQTRYHETLERYWADQNDWVNVEHDIVLGPDTIASLEACPWPWCCYVAELACGYTPGALGCVRFSHDLMTRMPSAMVDAGKPDTSGVVAKAWHRTDVRLDQILRRAGYVPHIHGRVTHLNPKQKLADPTAGYIDCLERSSRELVTARTQ